MPDLPLASQIGLYLLLALFALYTPMLAFWQVAVLKGKAMENPDGSFDDWHRQRTHYGIALADLVVITPASALGLVLVFVAPRWGFFLMSLVAFWYVWANLMTTATSLRFERPRITLAWIVVYPSGCALGLAYLAWTIAHFDALYPA
jgi:hypothetical protein